ncbi:MAG TPA: YCF48-related protein [Pyrinomonadaceae bacterium]|nr:YCF48-related protein [Pyrinomonadaceae bacterium]
MKNIIKVILLLSLLASVGNSFKAQTSLESKEGDLIKNSTTVSGKSFTNIAKRTNNCVMISGYSQFNNNFFLDSCINNWTIKEVASLGIVQDSHFIGGNSGWMIISGEIVKAENNELIEVDLGKIKNSYFNNVYFNDSQNGWAVGWKGKIIFTNDGGFSWKEQISPTNFNLTEIVFANANSGWIMGDEYTDGKVESVLLKTSNQGNSWEKVDQPQDDVFVKILFLNSLNGWAITRKGELKITKDGGNIWNNIKTSNKNFVDITFVDQFHGWGLTEDAVFYTKDGGSNWLKQLVLPNVFPYEFSKIIFLDKNNGWILSKKEVLQTNNAGQSWNVLEISSKLTKEVIK